MSELFPPDTGQQLSPRLQWLRPNGITVQRVDIGIGTIYVAERGPLDWANGATEDEAIADLAIKLGVKLWNES